MDGVREFDLTYEQLFSAPDKEGSIVSVRVHRKVKSVLEELARKEGLDGVSELVRYLIAGYLMGKYNIVRPERRVVVEPIVLNINVAKGGGRDDLDVELALQEVEKIVSDAEDYLRKLAMGVVIKNPEYIAKLNRQLVKAAKTAKRMGLDEVYAKILKLKSQLMVLG
ncbi:CopG domain protein DNA-binding domain protein [Thermoproteus uzoniensis 768-20]|uniref:CopG domain protein DNA-binding domain protein n=1 Tax=Thermoproteus uzoniensis (strain 768-20) TaxID=999630 RepID=F2L4B2_THEU7|nr:ribbon-helix-helix protein, CopG family [Thermoproteus uzoniensis]AEA13344.1 CopG domain protein DNA-binding domain protein [Thermoproteus uzoniensis 768-20]